MAGIQTRYLRPLQKRPMYSSVGLISKIEASSPGRFGWRKGMAIGKPASNQYPLMSRPQCRLIQDRITQQHEDSHVY